MASTICQNHAPTLDLREPVQRAMGWLRSAKPWARAAAPDADWWRAWGYGDVTGRMVEAFVLARRVLGHSRVGDEEARTRQFLVELFDSDDGLSWRPETARRRRAAHLFDQSSVLFGLVAQLEAEEDAKSAALLGRLVAGLARIAEWHGRGGDRWCRYPFEVYTPLGWTAAYDEFRDGRANVPADPCHEGGRQIRPLVRYHEISGSPEALRLAAGLTRFVVGHSGVFAADGSYLERRSRARGHVHSRLGTAAGVLRLGLLTGCTEWVTWARAVLDWTLAHAASSFGWISERAHGMEGGCETCCLTDAVDLAVDLAEAGYPEYWDLVERIARNHLLESQCPHTGGFSGHTMPNDYCWVHPATGQPEHHVGGCCSPAGVRALWRVWDRATVRQADTTWVHLPLQRDAAWASVTSGLPAQGHIAVHVRQPGAVMVRLPPWVAAGTVRLRRDGQAAPVALAGPYVRLEGVAAGQRLDLAFPIREERRAETIMGQRFEVTWRGSTVLAVEPTGVFEPLYQRRGG